MFLNDKLFIFSIHFNDTNDANNSHVFYEFIYDTNYQDSIREIYDVI